MSGEMLLERLRRLHTEVQGEDPAALYGEPPWSLQNGAEWESRHHHDIRLRCWKTQCQVVENAHEAAMDALPAILRVIEAAETYIKNWEDELDNLADHKALRDALEQLRG